VHLSRAAHADDRIDGRRLDRRRPGDERHGGAAPAGFGRQRESHAPAGSVADESDGVDVFDGRTRRHENAATPPRTVGRVLPVPSGVEGPVPSGVEGALGRARAAEADGRLDDTAREYSTALTGTLAGRHALYVGIGRLSQVQGEYDAAIAAFSEAALLSPNDPVIRRELAAAFVAAGRADDAFAELVAALLLAPENVEVLAAVGQLYLDTDRPAEAIPVLQRVLAIRATRYETHYALATALSRVGRTGDAARAFERFDRLSREALADRRRSVAGEAGPPAPAREPR
jgi:Flp pilus assembly protein TadD